MSDLANYDIFAVDSPSVQRSSFRSSYGPISYIERSGKIPAVFLHGLGGTGNSWIKLTQYLGDEFGLYFVDLLGQGRSAKPDIEYTIAVQVAMIDELVVGLGLEDFSLMGNSYGGWIAMRYTVDRRAPSHLILEDSAGINRTFGESGSEGRNRFVKMVVRSNPMNTEAIIGNIVKNNSDPKWKMRESDLLALKTKTLIVWGKEDGLIPLEYGKRLREMIPGSNLVEIEKAGHVPHVQFPETVARILSKFLMT